jgi:hypothetical protein
MFLSPSVYSSSSFAVDTATLLHFASSTFKGRLYERKRLLSSLDWLIFDDGYHEVPIWYFSFLSSVLCYLVFSVMSICWGTAFSNSCFMSYSHCPKFIVL